MNPHTGPRQNPGTSNTLIKSVGFTNRLVAYLVVIGIVAAWCGWVIVAQLTGTTPEESFSDPRSKPFIYYILHGIEILSVAAAGILAGINGGYGRLSRFARMAFWVLQITSITWALVVYDTADYLTWKALGSTGPMVWLTCSLIFAGMDRSVWKTLEPIIRLISYITAVLAMFSIITTHNDLTERWFSAPVQYMVLLMWFGGWTFITSWNCSGWRLYLRYFPYIVFIFTTIYTQTRSWFLMSLFLFIALLFVTKPSKETRRIITPKLVIISSTIALLLIITSLVLKDPLSQAFGAFKERALDDSRTGQYVEFFSQVPVTDLILGRGPNASWNFGEGEAYEEYQYFDNAYIWMAFIGGLPLVISYFMLIIFPGIKASLLGVQGNDAANAILIILWGLACTGFSTYINPSLTPYSYLIYLMAGRCHEYLFERQMIGKTEK